VSPGAADGDARPDYALGMSTHIDSPWLVPFDGSFQVSNSLCAPPDDAPSKKELKKKLEDEVEKLSDLQRTLYAQDNFAVLCVFQAMDAAGKDSTVRHVFGPINPAGCRVTSFKAPSKEELGHDYLWRVHDHAPVDGTIAVFNRSHYEELLIVRVKGFAPKEVWKRRYEHINAFEKMLADEGTAVVKFMIHISKDYQKERLQRRLDRPDKHWKFNPEDLAERAHWDDYMKAFGDVVGKCSTDHAPWYVIPSERRWYRNLAITKVLVDRLKAMNPQMPEPSFDPSAIVIDD